ncbi:MAG: hypothetical protein AABY15_06420 [Nanoarchaeota archaeon]
MKNIKDIDDIIPFSARALVVVEEGQVEAIIDDHLFSFTVQQYSNDVLTILIDHHTDTAKARKILKEYGVIFKKETKDEIHGEEFKEKIFEIYQNSNSKGGDFCSWTTDEELEFKEFKKRY